MIHLKNILRPKVERAVQGRDENGVILGLGGDSSQKYNVL